MNIEKGEYNVITQINRDLHIKIELLDFNMHVVGEIKGELIGSPTFSINSESDIRRTCSFSLSPKDASFDIKSGNKIWLNKYVRIYLGITNNQNGEIVYSNMGIYLINNPNSTYNSMENTVTIQGVDLMAKLTGLRNGNLEGIPYIIAENSVVEDAVIACLELAGFFKYEIENFPIKTPYEIKVDMGGTVYDILSELRAILPNYQMYFDVDGIFHFESTPYKNNEKIFVDDEVWKEVLIDYSKSIDFTSVKNVVEVFGRTHEIQAFGGEATLIDEQYFDISIKDFHYTNNLKLGFTYNNALQPDGTIVAPFFPSIRINSGLKFPIYNEYGEYADEMFDDIGDQYYVVRFEESETSTEDNIDGKWIYLGHIQPHAIAKEDSESSPFFVGGDLGEIRVVLSGGEYDNIYTDSLAMERAQWELYTRCRLQDQITLNCIPIYWLDVNKLISITLPNKNGNEEKTLYIIKSINTTFGVDGTQSIQCVKYHPYYERDKGKERKKNGKRFSQ